MKLFGADIFCLAAAVATVRAETIMTGDILEGYAVLSKLDTASLEDGSHRFWFRVAENACKYCICIGISLATG